MFVLFCIIVFLILLVGGWIFGEAAANHFADSFVNTVVNGFAYFLNHPVDVIFWAIVGYAGIMALMFGCGFFYIFVILNIYDHIKLKRQWKRERQAEQQKQLLLNKTEQLKLSWNNLREENQ